MREDVIFRPLMVDDADDVLKVLRENYQDDYFNAQCYDRAHLIQAHQSGEHVLYVAVLQTGEFVGVVGAKRARLFPGSYELSFHILRKKFQGQGIAKGLLAYCIRACEQDRRADTYGHCVTYHIITQNEMAQLGMKTVGMWLGRHLSNRAYLETYRFYPRSSKLHSLVINKRGVTLDAGTLYAPEGHENFVREAYDALGTACTLAPDPGAPDERARVAVREDDQGDNTDLYFLRAGRDAPSRLDACLKGARGPLHTVTALVNMTDPGCPALCRALKERGFFFSGVHPLHAGREYALYHRACREPYNFDELALTSGNRVIADYVRAQYERQAGLR